MNIPFVIGLQLFLIGLNAIFACAEIAVISMNDTKLDKLASEGNKRAQRLQKRCIPVILPLQLLHDPHPHPEHPGIQIPQ